MGTLEDLPGDSPAVMRMKALARALQERGPSNPKPQGMPNLGAYRADDPPEKVTGSDILADGVRKPAPVKAKDPWD